MQKYRRHHDTPVIMLASWSDAIDEVVSMSFGEDLYIGQRAHALSERYIHYGGCSGNCASERLQCTDVSIWKKSDRDGE